MIHLVHLDGTYCAEVSLTYAIVKDITVLLLNTFEFCVLIQILDIFLNGFFKNYNIRKYNNSIQYFFQLALVIIKCVS